MLEKPEDSARCLWILSGGRVGDLKQMQVLATALGWVCETKHLEFASDTLTSIPSLSPLLLTRASRAALKGPLPDVVLAAESRTAAVALALKARSGGRAKAICIGRPRGRLASFDLIITTPQYELPRADNIIELALPLTEQAKPPPSMRHDHLPRPHVFLMVGGSSAPFVLDAQVAARMASEVHHYVQQRGGTLFVSTSLRTGESAEAAIAGVAGMGERVFLWSRGGQDNPYRDFLATSDQCIATADSTSMITDAIMARKPTAIYSLPERWSLRQRLIQRLWQQARSNPASIAALAFNTGLVESRANRDALNAELVRKGLASRFGAEMHAGAAAIPDESNLAAQRVRSLFGL
jgi:uncharacterized protein